MLINDSFLFGNRVLCLSLDRYLPSPISHPQPWHTSPPRFWVDHFHTRSGRIFKHLKRPSIISAIVSRDKFLDDFTAELTELFEAAGAIVGQFVVVEPEQSQQFNVESRTW